jgi:hypothetical protein
VAVGAADLAQPVLADFGVARFACPSGRRRAIEERPGHQRGPQFGVVMADRFGQVPDKMGVALTVQRLGQVVIGGEAVMDDHPAIAGQDVELGDGVAAPLRVSAEPGQLRGGNNMEPPRPRRRCRHTDRGFVRVHDR